MKNILVAIDLTPRSENAFHRAIQLAEISGACLHVLHVAFTPGIGKPTAGEGAAFVRLKEKIQKRIKNSPQYKNGHFLVHITNGRRVRDEIDDYARRLSVDLIVMGVSRKYDGVPDFVFSTVERVVWQVGVSVLMVSEDVAKPYERVLVKVDLSTAPQIVLKPVMYFGDAVRIAFLNAHQTFPPQGGILGFALRLRRKHYNWRLKGFLKEARRILRGHSPKNRVLYKRLETVSLKAMVAEAESRESDVLYLNVPYTGDMTPEIDTVARDILKNPPCDILIARRG